MKRKLWLAVAGGLLVIALAFAGWWFFIRSDNKTSVSDGIKTDAEVDAEIQTYVNSLKDKGSKINSLEAAKALDITDENIEVLFTRSQVLQSENNKSLALQILKYLALLPDRHAFSTKSAKLCVVLANDQKDDGSESECRTKANQLAVDDGSLKSGESLTDDYFFTEGR